MEPTVTNVIQIAAYLVTFGVFLGVTQQQFKNITTQLTAQKEQLTIQIANLEKKVEKHNQVVERTYQNEKDIAVLKNRNSVSEHRIDDLEGGKKNV